MNILVIDNYDSFTYNLVHLIGELGAELTVRRNDKITLDEIADLAPEAIVLSPGPCTPNEAGICLSLVERFKDEIPMFGVCLGMQSIAQALGGDIVHAPNLMHGKVSTITHEIGGVFRGINGPFQATRYHSLVVEKDTLPDTLEVTASSDDEVVMGLSHKSAPLYGVQFHPESIASENGSAILQNFLDIARDFNKSKTA